MSAPSNRPPTPPQGAGWSPERELLEAAPRRYDLSPYPDYNQPNSGILLGFGGALLAAGLILFFFGCLHDYTKGGTKDEKSAGVKKGATVVAGILAALGGAAMVVTYPTKRKQHLDRAAHLVENGSPVMARIVKVDNMTGDSKHARTVTYMATLPGQTEETRKEVHADERSLPVSMYGNVTALLDYKTGELELYCALPYVAISKFATAPAPAADLTAQAGIPLQAATAPTPTPTRAATSGGIPVVPIRPATPTAAPAGDMAPLSGMGTTTAPPPAEEPDKTDKPRDTKRPASGGGAAKLPWEQ